MSQGPEPRRNRRASAYRGSGPGSGQGGQSSSGPGYGYRPPGERPSSQRPPASRTRGPGPPRSSRPAGPIRRYFPWVAGTLALLISGLLGYVLWTLKDLPDPGQAVASSRSIIVYDRKGREIQQISAEGAYHHDVTLSEISSEGGGWLLPQDAPKVREAAQTLLRERTERR